MRTVQLDQIEAGRIPASDLSAAEARQIRSFGDEQACFQDANDGRARDQWTYPLLENLREVPMAIYHGAADELVWTPGVARMGDKMRELGYRFGHWGAGEVYVEHIGTRDGFGY